MRHLHTDYPMRAGQNGIEAAVSPFQGFILLPLGTQASLVPRAAWAITVSGFQPFVVPLLITPGIPMPTIGP